MACLTNHLRWNQFLWIAVALLAAPNVRDARADESAAPPTGEALINAALGRPISCEYEQTSLADAVRDVEKKLGITVTLETRALDEAAIGLDTPITIRLTNISAAAALRHMFRRIDPTLTFSIRDDALTITTYEYAEAELETRFYDIADLAEDIDVKRVFWVSGLSSISIPFHTDFDAIVEIVTKVIEPDSWDEVGGPGSVNTHDGIMVVSQTWEVHNKITAALAAVRKAAAAYKGRISDLSVIDFRPSVEADAERAFAKLLDGKGLNLTFKETPLRDVAKAISEATKRTVLLDERSLDEIGIGTDTPVTCQLKGLRLRQELKSMLRTIDPTLTFHVWDEALVIAPYEAAEENLSTLMYPVWDLVDETPRRDYFGLIELITRVVEPDSWSEVGGPASIAKFPQVGCLLVSQTDSVHDRIKELLARLRAIETNRNASSKPADDDDTYVVVLYWLKSSLKQTPHDAKINALSGGPQDPSPIEAGDYQKIDAEVIPLIQQLIAPTSWSADQVVIRPLGKDLVVRQRISVHRQIGHLLRSLDLLEWSGEKH